MRDIPRLAALALTSSRKLARAPAMWASFLAVAARIRASSSGTVMRSTVEANLEDASVLRATFRVGERFFATAFLRLPRVALAIAY